MSAVSRQWEKARRRWFAVLWKLGVQSLRSRYGVRLAANWSDATFWLCIDGGYGPFLSSYLERIDHPFCFVDIGANQGLYSLLAAKNRHCVHIYAFEPVGPTAQLLRRNAELNRIRNITIAEQAISDRAGTVPIHLTADHSGAASLDHALGPGETIAIEAIDIGGFDAIVRPGPEALVVKIDVEGHEEVVIGQLLRSAHLGRIAAVYYECNEGWTDTARIRRMLDDAGFTRREVAGTDPDHYDVLASRA